MKISTATVVSSIGVVLAGAAAFAFNTAVLTPPSSVPNALLPAANTSSQVQSQEMPAPGVATSENNPGAVAASDASSTPLSGVAGVPVAPIADPSERVFKLGVLGSVTVRMTDSGVEVVAIDSSWKSSVTQTSKGVIVKLSQGDQVMAFNASLSQGDVKASLVNLTPAPVKASPRHDEPRDVDGEEHEEEHEEHEGHEEEDDD